jgi:hypothetical protein
MTLRIAPDFWTMTMPRGTTCEEVERGTGLPHQTVSARRTDLRTAEYTMYLLDSTGARVQRPTRTGAMADVEVATKRGIEAIKYGLPLMLKSGDPTAGRHGGNPTSQAAFKTSSRQTGALAVLAYMVKYS